MNAETATQILAQNAADHATALLAEAHVLKCANCDNQDALVYHSDTSLKRRKYYCVPCAKTLSGYRYAYATDSSLARGHGED